MGLPIHVLAFAEPGTDPGVSLCAQLLLASYAIWRQGLTKLSTLVCNLPGSAFQVFEAISLSRLAWVGQSFSKFIKQKPIYLFLNHLLV